MNRSIEGSKQFAAIGIDRRTLLKGAAFTATTGAASLAYSPGVAQSAVSNRAGASGRNEHQVVTGASVAVVEIESGKIAGYISRM